MCTAATGAFQAVKVVPCLFWSAAPEWWASPQWHPVGSSSISRCIQRWAEAPEIMLQVECWNWMKLIHLWKVPSSHRQFRQSSHDKHEGFRQFHGFTMHFGIAKFQVLLFEGGGRFFLQTWVNSSRGTNPMWQTSLNSVLKPSKRNFYQEIQNDMHLARLPSPHPKNGYPNEQPSNPWSFSEVEIRTPPILRHLYDINWYYILFLYYFCSS